MQPNRTTRARQREWLARILHDYSGYSFAELTQAHADLLADFAAADGFGLLAGRGIKAVCIEGLQAVGAEFQRRAALGGGAPSTAVRLRLHGIVGSERAVAA